MLTFDHKSYIKKLSLVTFLTASILLVADPRAPSQRPLSAGSASPTEPDLHSAWLRQCLFCPSSRSVRQLSAHILQALFTFYALAPNPVSDRKKLQLAELLGQFLDEASSTGENFAEFLSLFKHVLGDREAKYHLVLNSSVLAAIERLLGQQIRCLSELERLSELQGLCHATNLNYGHSVRSLAELLALFLKEAHIKNKFKGRLIATVLNSYLSLKTLVYLRTRPVEEAQEKLLATLEQLTSGTEAETPQFMAICIDTVNNFGLNDLATPVFLFERLCNIIYPEEVVDNKEFLLVLEKDPNQEDYLQGRMLGNPYSSAEPSLGPLMRNVKNKICTDCELVALLEDDNGMELLVNNKIISLDLPVRDVFKKVMIVGVAGISIKADSSGDWFRDSQSELDSNP